MRLRRFVPIIIIAVVGIYLYNRFISDNNSKLRISLSGSAKYQVLERGEIHYSDSKNVKIKNEYEVIMNVHPKDDVFIISGEISNIKAPVLLPFVKSNSFYVVTDNNYCPSKTSFIYPSEIRKLNYYITDKEVFEGKIWKNYFCNGSFSCEYEIEKVNDNNVEIYTRCDGTASEKEISMISHLIFSRTRKIFTALDMDISVKTGNIKSDWHFSDRIKK